MKTCEIFQIQTWSVQNSGVENKKTHFKTLSVQVELMLDFKNPVKLYNLAAFLNF